MDFRNRLYTNTSFRWVLPFGRRHSKRSRNFQFASSPSLQESWIARRDRSAAMASHHRRFEQHLYAIPAVPGKRMIVAEKIEKDFHVSPFMSLDMHYRMMFTHPGERLGEKMENFEKGKRIFDVSMKLNRKPITRWNLNRLLLSYPLISMKIFVGIYWHAMRLYLKRIPFHRHPGNDDPPSSGNDDQSTTNKPSKSNSLLAN